MKKYMLTAVILAIMIAGCSTDPSAPSGSLPTVQNLTINETASKGDSVVLEWDALDVDIDAYHIYFATTVPGNWGEPGATTATTWTHVATSTGYYEIKASKGADYSTNFSNRVNSRAQANYTQEQQLRAGTASNGLIFDDDGLGWGTGVADSAEFHQDLYVGLANNMVFLYSGNHNPAQFPGGSDTKLCLVGTHGNVAPDAGSSEWVDSVQVTGPNWVFVQLDNNHFTEFYVDSVFTNGADLPSFEYQLIDDLRLFNVL